MERSAAARVARRWLSTPRVARRWVQAQESRPYRVGIVGYSGEWGTDQWSFNPDEARALIRQELWKLSEDHRGHIVEIVSGLTDIGVPKLAYEIANQFGMLTTGFAPESAQDYPHHHVDKVIYVGTGWGDESEAFLTYCDMLIKIGGGEQSAAEFASFSGPKVEHPLERRER